MAASARWTYFEPEREDSLRALWMRVAGGEGDAGDLYTATGIRTPVSGLRIRRPSPLDDSGEDAGILASQRAGARDVGHRKVPQGGERRAALNR
jgi:hypothetical protein